MATTYEWVEATQTPIPVLPGEITDAHEISNDAPAIVIGDAIVEGPVKELERFAAKFTAAVASLRAAVLPGTCIHCGRYVESLWGGWIDPNATGDDSIWRETCDHHDTFEAEHEVTQ